MHTRSTPGLDSLLVLMHREALLAVPVSFPPSFSTMAFTSSLFRDSFPRVRIFMLASGLSVRGTAVRCRGPRRSGQPGLPLLSAHRGQSPQRQRPRAGGKAEDRTQGEGYPPPPAQDTSQGRLTRLCGARRLAAGPHGPPVTFLLVPPHV